MPTCEAISVCITCGFLFREERRRERREREGGRDREGRRREKGREGGQGSRSERARAWEEETPQSRPPRDSGDTPYSRRTGERINTSNFNYCYFSDVYRYLDPVAEFVGPGQSGNRTGY